MPVFQPGNNPYTGQPYTPEDILGALLGTANPVAMFRQGSTGLDMLAKGARNLSTRSDQAVRPTVLRSLPQQFERPVAKEVADDLYDMTQVIGGQKVDSRLNPYGAANADFVRGAQNEHELLRRFLILLGDLYPRPQ